LTGVVTVDCTLGDVQYGKIEKTELGITLAFSKWPPSGTSASVEVILDVYPGQVLNIPATTKLGVDSIEGYKDSSITIPNGVTRVHYQFNTIDCGTTLEIVPIDRPRQSTQIRYGVPGSNANVGGTITTVSGNTSATATGNVALSTGTTLVFGNGYPIGNIVSNTYNSNSNTTAITLSSAPNVSATGEFAIFSNKGQTGDVVGDIKTDGGNIYICSNVYNGSSNIWATIGNSSAAQYSNGNARLFLASLGSNVINSTANITTTAAITAGSLSLTGPLALPSSLTAASIVSNNSLTTNSLSAGNITVSGNITISGTGTLSVPKLTVSGNTTLANATATGNITGNYVKGNIIATSTTANVLTLAGNVGQIIIDTANAKMWVCVANTTTGGSANWKYSPLS
jgi:hypothetical protein